MPPNPDRPIGWAAVNRKVVVLEADLTAIKAQLADLEAFRAATLRLHELYPHQQYDSRAGHVYYRDVLPTKEEDQ